MYVKFKYLGFDLEKRRKVVNLAGASTLILKTKLIESPPLAI